jgi:outer membrane lipoprotein-sorting protein
MLSGIQSYIVTAEIIIKGNKLVDNYIVKQYFKYPDRYRLEVLGPEDKKGKTTIYDGEKLMIHHPMINQIFETDSFKEVEDAVMFPGYFAGKLFTGEDAEYSMKKDGSDEYVAIKVRTPGGNNYRRDQILYVDSETEIPVKMEVYDSAGNIVVTIYYKDFSYNCDIDDKLFTKEGL